MPWYKSLIILLLSTALINGPFWGGWFFYKKGFEKKQKDPAYQLKSILSQSLGEELLRPEIIAEWLNLSTDKKVNLYAVDLKRASKVLSRQLPIKKAKVSRKPPSTLVIEAEIRKPIAFVGERSNIAIDYEGNVFPFNPFYTPKKLPKLFTGKKENFKIAQKVLKWLDEKGKLETVEILDVRHAKASSLGEREVVIGLKGIFARINPDFIEEGLNKLFTLKLSKGNIVDLRVEGVALVLGYYLEE